MQLQDLGRFKLAWLSKCTLRERKVMGAVKPSSRLPLQRRRSGTIPGRVPYIVMSKEIRGWLTQLGTLTAHPGAFAVFAIYSTCWLIIGHGYEWHSLATMATWGMTLVIQRAEHRDTQAIHAKLDELLKGVGNADSKIAHVDDKDAEEVEHDREVRR
jgi:hypothetical protein